VRSIAIVVSVAALGLFLGQPRVGAWQGLLPGRAEGASSVNVSKTTLEKVTAALKKVFVGDGFRVAGEDPQGIVFERPARLAKDVSYSPVQGGTWERVTIVINNTGEGSFNLQCYPAIVRDKDQGIFEEEDRVLDLFAGEYRRLMRRVAREI
jgi:hypothetical protein